MKKFYEFDIATNEMTITEADYKKMTTWGTPEYKTYIALRKDFPNITIKFKSSDKETHKNLSFETMVAIIKENAETAEVMLKEFETAKLRGKVRKATYGKTKQWFLANYPNWKNYVLATSENVPATTENNSTETMNKSA